MSNTQNTPTPAQAAELPEETNLESTSENTEENQEDTEESSANEATTPAISKQEAKKIEKQLKKLKLKVDNREIEEEIDLSDDEYLTKQLQLAKVAQKRMAEHSELEKEVRAFINELKTNPRRVLADPNIGVDIKQLAASIIEEEIANSQKSPEQLEKERLENELKAIKEEREKEKEEHRQRELLRLQEQEYERYDLLMSKALEKSDLPKTPYVVKKMADYMLMGLQEGHNVTPEDVLPLVREEMQQDLKEMFAIMPDEVIESIVGKDVIGRIRKKNLSKAKQNPPTAPTKALKDVGQTGKAEEGAPVQKKTIKEFFGI